MQMIELAEKDISVYLCSFDIIIQSANIAIKFPCHYFLEWKSLNGKVLACSKKYPSANQTNIQFNQTLSLTTEMLYQNTEKKFFKKQTLLTINLVSKSRPDQIKLVGRVNIDLSVVANNTITMYSQFAPYKLTYCSVNADVTFKLQMTAKELTNKQPHNLDKSSFNDFFVFNSTNTLPPEIQAIKPLMQKSSSSNIQNTTFPIIKSKQDKSSAESFIKVEKLEKVLTEDVYTVSNFATFPSKNQEERWSKTVYPRKELTIKTTTNDSIQHNSNNLWQLKQQKFSEEIDYNKRKIDVLERKISQLCKNLEESKSTVQRKDYQNRQKEELIEKLKENQTRIREQYESLKFESLKKMKNSVSSNQVIQISQHNEDFVQNEQNKKQLESQNNLRQLLNQQKISEMLQTQRMLQENKFIIRQLESARSELEKKLANQRSETQQLQNIWKEKKEHLQEKIREHQKEKRHLNSQIQGLNKYRFRVQEAVEERNKLKLEYKQLQRQLMGVKIQLSDKTQKVIQMQQRLQSKQSQLEHLKLQLKQKEAFRANTEKLLNDQTLLAEKLKQSVFNKEHQISLYVAKISEAQRQISNLSNELNQGRKLEEEKRKMEEQLNQYNSHMQTLQATIKNLQTQIQACQYITKINQNLKEQISRQQTRISLIQHEIQSRDTKILEKEQQILNLDNKISLLTEQKQLLLQKNNSFTQQLSCIENILKESFHKASKQYQEQIDKLKEQIRVGNDQYEHVLKEKALLQEDIEALVEQKQQIIAKLQKNMLGLQVRIQDLCKTVNDKQHIISLKEIQLQNRQIVSEQLSKKLEQMQQKQDEMQETINILEIQSRKIFDIISEKQSIDQEMIQLRQSIQNHLQIIQQLQDTILNMKMQKEELIRKYERTIQTQNEFKDIIKQKQQLLQKQFLQNEFLRKRIRQAETVLQQMNQQVISCSQQIKKNNSYIRNLETSNQILKKSQQQLQQIIEQQQNSSMSVPIQLPVFDPTQILQRKQAQMRLHLETYQNEISGLKNQRQTLTQKLIELENIINREHIPQLNNNLASWDKSHQITPVKHSLNDELHLQSAQNNFFFSERKNAASNRSNNPFSNRSNESMGSFEYIQACRAPLQEEIKQFGQNQQQKIYAYHESIPELQLRQLPRQMESNQAPRINQRVLTERPTEVHRHQIKVTRPLNVFRQISEQVKPSLILFNSGKQGPQLKIKQLMSKLQVKEIIAKEQEKREFQLRTKINELQRVLQNRNNQSSVFTGRIRQNSPKKAEQQQLPQIPSSPNSKRRRSRSPSPKIVSNNSLTEKQMAKLHNLTDLQAQEIKRLKKNIRLMNLELTTLRNLKKEKIIGGTQIKINRTFSQQNLAQSSNLNEISDTNYFNLTNAVNPNEKSYIIKKNLNEQEIIYDTKRSPKKLSRYGQIKSNRQNLQKKHNISEKVSCQLFAEPQTDQGILPIEHELLSRFQNTAQFSVLNQEPKAEFVTTINDLRLKISELQESLAIIEEEKAFLQNQIQIFEEDRFCLSSDLNARQIQVYQLYKSIVGMRQEIYMLKYQNEAYLKMIEDHEANVNSIVRKAEQNCQRMNKDNSNQMFKNQNDKLGSISVSNIEYQNEQLKSSISCDMMIKEPLQGQQKLSMLQKIERYEKKMEQSLFVSKQKQILQEEIQSKQEIMIDQNQKIFEQQTKIKQLHDRIKQMESQIHHLQYLVDNKDSSLQQQIVLNSNNQLNKDNSALVQQNQRLVGENANLKEELNYMGSQIDRVNEQCNKLNELLIKRQETISKLNNQIQELNNVLMTKEEEHLTKFNHFQTLITQLQHQIAQNMAPNPAVLSFIQKRVKDLYQQFSNFKLNIQGAFFCDPPEELGQDSKEFLCALIDSMEHNIATTINVITEASN